MKLYLAYKNCNTLMEGDYENCVGVFETRDKAWDYLKTTSDFEYSKSINQGAARIYYFDGEMAYYWHVKEVELNKGFCE